MLCRKTGNKTMNRSEESMTRMTSYRLPHYGNRSFTFVQDDVLPSIITQTGAEKESSFYSFTSFPQASILRPASPATSL